MYLKNTGFKEKHGSNQYFCNMLSLNDISLYFGDRPLYYQTSLHIKPKDRIGLIGKNGTGKTTLLKMIIGEVIPDEGSISRAKDCTIGFLNQDLLSYQTVAPILEVAMQAFEKENHLLHKINELLVEIETDYTDDKIETLSKLQEQFDVLGGYTIQSKAEEILEGLGFTTQELTQPLQDFSGGWRMRVMLAKILLAKPSLLLLDEPTNHLDLPSIEWLEKYVCNYDGALIIISHDQEFLDKTVNKIVETKNSILNQYNGTYSFYLAESELRNEIQGNAFKNQQKKKKEAEEFINRFKAKASKARQVQSRVKALEKVDFIEDVEEDTVAINFQFKFSRPTGKVVLDLKDFSKSYGEKLIFKSSNATVLKGDKIALIGANGKGKSTLLRIISGDESIGGTREMGHNISQGFFAQHQLESLSMDNDLIQELKDMNSDHTELELRSLLGSFLFVGDDVFKKIKVLSGGEKSRVALAKTLIDDSNFLMLDEPTNHLDFTSTEMLIQALQQYEGTFIAVSHNRHFIREVANKIWFIEDYQLKEFPGNMAEFNYWMDNRDIAAEEQATKKSKEKKVNTKPKSNDDQNKIRKLKKEIESVENEIESKEGEKSKIEEEMSKPSVYGNSDEMAKYVNLAGENEKSLSDKNELWETLLLELEELES